MSNRTHEKWHQETEGGWQVPSDLAERVSKADYRDAWGLEIKRTAEVREILQDLIAELVGDDGDGHELTGAVEDGCQVCAAIDRAEARLREVQGE